ncbi:MAG: glycine zipper domain-containing protein [Planctomycetaceae bacterium]
MLTLFDLIRLIGALVGAVVFGSTGWNTLGILGCVVGAPVGLVVGAMIGQMPLIVCLKWMSRRFDRMTDEQLEGELHDPACLTPNILLLELNRRGFDIRRELPFVQSLLASDEMHRRTAGWAALNSAFPELVGRIPSYNPTATTAECKAECEPLLNATEPKSA